MYKHYKKMTLDELEKEQNRLNQLIAETSDGVFVKDRRFKLQKLSQLFAIVEGFVILKQEQPE